MSKVYKTGAIELSRARQRQPRASRRATSSRSWAPSGSGKSDDDEHPRLPGRSAHPGIYRLDGIDVGTLRENALADIRNQPHRVRLPVVQPDPAHVGAVAQRRATAGLRGAGPRAPRPRAARAGTRRARRARAATCPTSSPAGSSSASPSPARWSRDPTMILADEPTGNLDTVSTIEIMELFVELNDVGPHRRADHPRARGRRVRQARGHAARRPDRQRRPPGAEARPGRPDDGHTEVFAAVTALASDAPKHALDAPADEGVDPGEPTRPVLRKDLDR